MCVNDNDQGRGKQDAKTVLLRRLAVIEHAVRDVRQDVHRSVRTSCSVLALQGIRRDIAAFEVGLMEARLRRLAASATSPEEGRLVSEFAPFIIAAGN